MLKIEPLGKQHRSNIDKNSCHTFLCIGNKRHLCQLSLNKIMFSQNEAIVSCNHIYKDNYVEIGHQNSAQVGQLIPLFDTFVDLVNRVGEWQNTDWWVPNSFFCPTEYDEVHICLDTRCLLFREPFNYVMFYKYCFGCYYLDSSIILWTSHVFVLFHIQNQRESAT